MTPDDLRELANEWTTEFAFVRRTVLSGAASAWERDREERDALRKRVEELESALRPALDAIDKIGANPNNLELRRAAEIESFYRVQMARRVLETKE